MMRGPVSERMARTVDTVRGERRRRSARRAAGTVAAVVLALGLVVLAIGRLPDITRSRLPGAAGGSHTYAVRAQFTDVLDLVPNSTVRLADVPVGRVTGIRLAGDPVRGHVAVVTLAVDDRYRLPADTTAAIRSTSLLGEKYVALTAPEGGTGSLRTTGVIPLARTTQDVEVEQLLGSIGAVLNGGALQQLSTITHELSTALGGREDDTRALLGNLDQIMAGLDDGRSALVSAIDATARLSTTLAAQNDVIGQAVRDLDPASGVLARQQRALTTALRKLDRLDATAAPLIRRGTDATVADLRALAPVVTELGKVADLIPENLTLLFTYPFADTAVPAFSGGYGAVKGTVVVDLPELLRAVAPVPQNQSDGQVPGYGPMPPDRPTLPPSAPTPGASSPAAPSATSGPSSLLGGLSALLSPGGGGTP